MGCDKAWLEVEGKPLIARVLAAARPVADRLVIVINGSSPNLQAYRALAQHWDAELRADIHTGHGSGLGPLAGIEASLLGCRDDEAAMILACDLPYVSSEFLGVLRRRHEEEQPSITVPVDQNGRLQPLAAIYSRSCLRTVEEQLAGGRLRVDLLFDLVPTHRLFSREYGHLAGADRFFLNLNTPDDLERASGSNRVP